MDTFLIVPATGNDASMNFERCIRLTRFNETNFYSVNQHVYVREKL